MKAYRAALDGRAGWRLAFTYDEQEVLELLPEFEAFLRQAPLPGMA